MALGLYPCIYAPSGNYLINGSTTIPSFAQGKPGCVVGDGSAQTIFTMGPAFSGDLFAWAEAWIVYNSGPYIAHLRINGTPSAPAQQNAVMLYDRNDNPRLEDLYINGVPGRAIGSGILRPSNSSGQAYIREAHWSDIHVFNDGAAGVPCVEFATQGSGNEDGTNEISVDRMDIYGCAGTSLKIDNSSATGVVRDLKFSSLRLEGTQNGTAAADLLDIGDPSMTGGVGHIGFTNFEAIDPYTNYAAVRVTSGAAAGAGPSRIYMQGFIGGGLPNGTGLAINNGSLIYAKFNQIVSASPNITIGPNVANVTVDGDGAETAWSYSIDPSTTVQVPLRSTGTPTAGTNFAATTGSVGTLTVGNGGVNVTGGGVTSLTMVNTGSYVGTVPTISFPTPVGGSPAAASVTGMKFSQAIPGGLPLSGTGYVVGDLLTVTGGATTNPNIFKVTAVDGNGKPTGVTANASGATSAGVYTTLPPAATPMTGGSGTGATITCAYYVATTNLSAGGSGYQTNTAATPTFSASAYGAATATSVVNTSLPIAAASGKVLLNGSGTTLGVAGISGSPVINAAATEDPTIATSTPATGATITAAANTASYFVDGTATLSTLTFKLPPLTGDSGRRMA